MTITVSLCWPNVVPARGFVDIDAGGCSEDEVGDVLGKSEVMVECESKYARVTIECDASAIKSDIKVVMGLAFIRCKKSNRGCGR